MGLHRTEVTLTVLYVVAILLSLVTLVTTTVAWTHWWEVLENCEESGIYCGCVLYGSETFNYFTGGKNVLCHFVVYATVPVLVAALLLAGYHGYRSCISTRQRSDNKGSRVPVQARRRSGETIALSTFRPDDQQVWAGGDPACVCWTPLAVLAALLSALLFAQAVVLSDGYRSTCREYRKHLVKTLMATGTSATVIYDRIGCDSVLDFMDYLEPFTRPFRPHKDTDWKYPFMEQRDRTRGGMINTAVALKFAMATTWLNWIVFIAIVVQNVVLARTSGMGLRCCC